MIANFSAALRIDFSRATASINFSDVINRMLVWPLSASQHNITEVVQKMHRNNAKLAEF